MSEYDELHVSPSEEHQSPNASSLPPDQSNVSSSDLDQLSEKPFDQLTLSEYLGVFFRSPAFALNALSGLLKDRPNASTEMAITSPETAPSLPVQSTTRHKRWLRLRSRGQLRLAGNLLGLFFVIWGCMIFVSTPVRAEDGALAQGAPFALLGVLLWFYSELSIYSLGIKRFAQRLNPLQRILFVVSLGLAFAGLNLIPLGFFVGGETGHAIVGASRFIIAASVASAAVLSLGRVRRPRIDSDEGDQPEVAQSSSSQHSEAEELPWYMRVHPVRVFLVIGAVFGSVITWIGSTGNTFTTLGFYVWLATIAAWVAAVSPGGFQASRWFHKVRSLPSRFSWRRWAPVIAALVLILILAAGFRLNELATHPPEMTSDHVEMLLDGQRIVNGQRIIFFANNGGREPFQMYALALFGQMTGMGVSFYTLKLLGAIESLITVVVLFWLGIELAGLRYRRLGILLGLAMAALLAASYWHVAISRQAERIMLTPLITAIIVIYLSRGLRNNRRKDFIIAGLALGLGLYMYQAVRMIPAFIILAGLAKLTFDQGGLRSRFTTIVNFSTLVLISAVVFIPMFHYSVEHPEEFWRRTTGRLLGDEIVEVTLPNGAVTYRQASLQERIEAFNENVPVLLNNIRNVLLMFNWKGDVAWINGYPNQPAMDVFSGALFLVGIGAWLIMALKRRDLVLWLIPILIFVMLLPSALSIAYPVENPSHTRTSGAIPAVYALAALPLALLAERITRQWRSKAAGLAALGVFVFLVGASNAMNTRTYFNEFRQSYITSSLPYSDAGRVLLGFALSDGSFGNAFMIAYPFWWDHRAIGLEAGLTDWPNGIVSLDQVPAFLRDSAGRSGPYRLNPDRDLLFFYSKADQSTEDQLRAWFPQGRDLLVPSYQAGDDFKVYRVPALGEDGLIRFIQQNLAPTS